MADWEHLQAQQMGSFAVSRDDSWQGETKYNIWQQNPDPEQPHKWSAVGNVEIHHHQNHPVYHYPPEHPDSNARGLWSHGAEGPPRFQPRQGQQMLFHSDEEAPRHEVYIMQTSKGARHIAMPLLGHIHRKALEDTGHGILPSDDLSEHSSRLVGHLKKTGVLSRDTVSDQSNNLTWAPEPTSNYHYETPVFEGGEHVVTREELKQGSRVARSLVRGEVQKRRAARRAPLQPRLFGDV